MQRRIYVPVTRAALVGLRSGGGLTGTPLVAFAATAQLRSEHPGADEEELEYLAFLDAIRAGGPGVGSRRVVGAADVEQESVAEPQRRADRGPASEVGVLDPVPLRRLVSFHVEEASGGGSPAKDEGEFLWYDVTELDALLDLLA